MRAALIFAIGALLPLAYSSFADTTSERRNGDRKAFLPGGTSVTSDGLHPEADNASFIENEPGIGSLADWFGRLRPSELAQLVKEPVEIVLTSDDSQDAFYTCRITISKAVLGDFSLSQHEFVPSPWPDSGLPSPWPGSGLPATSPLRPLPASGLPSINLSELRHATSPTTVPELNLWYLLMVASGFVLGALGRSLWTKPEKSAGRLRHIAGTARRS